MKISKHVVKNIFLWSLLLLPYLGLIFVHHQYKGKLKEIDNTSVIIISKQEMQLRLIDFKGKELLKVPIAVGLNPGNKKKKGDMKTPEGVFSVSEVKDASRWKHDFNDGKGEIEGAYGNYFIRLRTPGHQGIGIHGTHDSESVGTRATEGCIRLKNEDMEKLIAYISLNMAVIITPGKEDVKTE